MEQSGARVLTMVLGEAVVVVVVKQLVFLGVMPKLPERTVQAEGVLEEAEKVQRMARERGGPRVLSSLPTLQAVAAAAG